MTTKAEIRALLRDRVAAMTPEEKAAGSLELNQRLLQDPTLQTASSFGVFLPLQDEPDLRPAVKEFLKKGHTVALPFLIEDDIWAFCQITTLEPDSTGPWKLGFPSRGREIPAANLTAVLVPGRGFTTAGDRIGRGKGIYDRLLQNTPARKIGVCFSCQLVEELPVSEHDVCMDEVWVA